MRLYRKKRYEDGLREVYIFGFRICKYRVKRRDDWGQQARNSGVKLGNNVQLVSPHEWGSEPWLIEVGDDTCISFGVTFLTHDGAVWACKPYVKDYNKISKLGRIKIGKECFIGCKTTIMPSVTIGENCVIGACSLVTKNVPSGEVWGGVPARFICKTSELASKIEVNSESDEQKELVKLCLKWRKSNE